MRTIVLALAAAASLVGGLSACRSVSVEADYDFPGRVYYYEPWDTENVYFYDERRPEVIEHRRFARDHERAYFVEGERRVYYDHAAAGQRHGPERRR